MRNYTNLSEIEIEDLADEGDCDRCGDEAILCEHGFCSGCCGCSGEPEYIFEEDR